MSHINTLIQKGEELVSEISIEKFDEISAWFTEIQIYAEKNYKDLTITKTILSKIEQFTNFVRSEEIVEKNLVVDILNAVKGIKSYEENEKTNRPQVIAKFF